MNCTPTLRNPGADGGQAQRNREAAFWQSRHPRHVFTPITDLRALARAIRSKPQ